MMAKPKHGLRRSWLMDNPKAHMEQALVVITLSTATLLAGFGLLVTEVLRLPLL
jgi:hypothetical protein